MALIDDQVDGSKPELLGRFITAVIAAAELIYEEPDTTQNHAARVALAHRIIRDKQAQAIGHDMLRLALARNARLAVPRTEVTDTQIANAVMHYIDIFTATGY